jgi:hypothetical protein
LFAACVVVISARNWPTTAVDGQQPCLLLQVLGGEYRVGRAPFLALAQDGDNLVLVPSAACRLPYSGPVAGRRTSFAVDENSRKNVMEYIAGIAGYIVCCVLIAALLNLLAGRPAFRSLLPDLGPGPHWGLIILSSFTLTLLALPLLGVFERRR